MNVFSSCINSNFTTIDNQADYCFIIVCANQIFNDHSEGKSEEKSKHKSKHHKHDRREISNFKELSDADYFLKNNEFSTWLKDEKDTFFSDLSSESARKLFSKFVKRWNDKKLDSKYYDGIATAQRSSHSWKLKSDSKGDTQKRLESNRDI
ncbi:hypothetical protein CTI12_AA229910 [Artemisia annua]|uniref:Uncharacterized protein n=1 Tax=Artemisia annua TaxID=35608 RepID=A0A2U1NTF1_ARTAN|nr:hypothetical protein CTI12_AA229910 [Artemisia annua]